MGAIRRSEGELTRLVVVGLLLQVAQNAADVSGRGGGPSELLTKGDRSLHARERDVKAGRYLENGVPDYLLQLRQRHSKEWMNFGQVEGGSGPNLGIITSIHHHRPVASKVPSNAQKRFRTNNEFRGPKERWLRWENQQNLNFRIARFSPDEQLIAGSLRLPIRGVINNSIPVAVRVMGFGGTSAAALHVETNGVVESAWLNVPLPPASLHSLLRRRRLLQLRVDLPDTTIVDTSTSPHLLTFHRSHKQSGRLKRTKREVGPDAATGDNEKHQVVNRNRKTRRRSRRKSKAYGSNRKKRSPQYFMNQRYISSTCQRRNLMVNFNTVGWSRWVIAPTTYNAGYCYGYCPFPLSAHFNTTNHAIIIHLMYNLRVAPPHVTPPCCIPLTFSSQSILFFDGDEVVLQVYEDMTVETCGCR